MRLASRDLGIAFDLAFGVRYPWRVASVGLSRSRKVLDVLFDHACTESGICPFCGDALIDVFFSTKRTWHHVNFFQFETTMTACLPLFRCSNPKCIASHDREAVENTFYLDVLLMVSPSGTKSALEGLLTLSGGDGRGGGKGEEVRPCS